MTVSHSQQTPQLRHPAQLKKMTAQVKQCRHFQPVSIRCHSNVSTVNSTSETLHLKRAHRNTQQRTVHNKTPPNQLCTVHSNVLEIQSPDHMPKTLLAGSSPNLQRACNPHSKHHAPSSTSPMPRWHSHVTNCFDAAVQSRQFVLRLSPEATLGRFRCVRAEQSVKGSLQF
jgi:hypothetical protein